jgi:hypothetical protein
MTVMAMVLGEGEPAAGPWRVMALTQLARRLRPGPRARLGRPRVLAVDGRSGSGKTTLAARIQGVIPASVVVHTDDIAWHHAMFDWADLLIAGIGEPVRRGEPVRFRPPAWQQRNRNGAIEVPPDLDLVIIEGAGAGRRELRPMADTVIWVQSDMPEAERRGIERDGGDEQPSRSGACGWPRSCRSWLTSNHGHEPTSSSPARRLSPMTRRPRSSPRNPCCPGLQRNLPDVVPS